MCGQTTKHQQKKITTNNKAIPWQVTLESSNIENCIPKTMRCQQTRTWKSLSAVTKESEWKKQSSGINFQSLKLSKIFTAFLAASLLPYRNVKVLNYDAKSVLRVLKISFQWRIFIDGFTIKNYNLWLSEMKWFSIIVDRENIVFRRRWSVHLRLVVTWVVRHISMPPLTVDLSIYFVRSNIIRQYSFAPTFAKQRTNRTDEQALWA